MRTVSLKLSDALLRKLERAARERGQSKSAVIRSALEQHFNGERSEPRPVSALELAGDLVCSVKGPGDLSTNPRYLEGFGE